MKTILIHAHNRQAAIATQPERTQKKTPLTATSEDRASVIADRPGDAQQGAA